MKIRSIKSFVAITLIGSLISSFGYGLDVTSQDVTNPHYVKVTLSNDRYGQLIKFEYCEKHSGVCSQLGKRGYYSLDEIRKKHTRDNRIGLTVLGGAITWVTLVGFLEAAMRGPYLRGPGPLTFIQIAIIGGSLLFSRSKNISYYDERLLADQNVSTADIASFANELNDFLNNNF